MPAVDDRVVAIAPLVMPSANITADVNLLWRSQGGWPFVMEPYYQQNITYPSFSSTSFLLFFSYRI